VDESLGDQHDFVRLIHLRARRAESPPHLGVGNAHADRAQDFQRRVVDAPDLRFGECFQYHVCSGRER